MPPTPPRHLRRMFAGLLHQQCWLWGRDIRHPEGNLLLRYGMERRPRPADRPGVSSYRVAIDAHVLVHLWGFGLAIARRDGPAYFVGRFEAVPAQVRQVSALPEVWHVRDLPRREPGDTLPGWWAVVEVAEWVVWYERWVVAQAGLPWRERALHGWNDAVTSAGGAATAWERLSARLRDQILRVAIPTRADAAPRGAGATWMRQRLASHARGSGRSRANGALLLPGAGASNRVAAATPGLA